MISELNIETTVNLKSVQTFLKGSRPLLYQRSDENTYALLVSRLSHISFSVNSAEKELERQSVFLCLPGDMLRIESAEPLESDVQLVTFQYFPPEGIRRQSKSAVQLPMKAMIDNPRFYELLDDILAETTYDIYNYKPRLNILLAYLLLYLCRFCKHKVLEGEPVEHEEIPPYVKIVLDYLDCNYQRDVSSLDIQRHVGLNYDYVNTIFKQYVGATIMKYLDNLRISAARELLQHTILPINEIAGRVGIVNPQYFTKKFNSLVGMSPVKYRQLKNEKSGK